MRNTAWDSLGAPAAEVNAEGAWLLPVEGGVSDGGEIRMLRIAWALLRALAVIVLAALAAVSLSGCRPESVADLALTSAADSASEQGAIERGAEERPALGIAATLPPEDTRVTPTALTALDDLASGLAQDGLSANGPWVLYCAADGRGALMDLDGRGRMVSPLRCPEPQTTSPAAGLALQLNTLIQFPGIEAVRWAPDDAFVWAADGSLALLSNAGLERDNSLLTVYDVAADRFRQLVKSRYEVAPLGLSPDGRWAVYTEYDRFPQTQPDRQPPAEVLAISTDLRQTLSFFSEYGAGLLSDRLLGWLSDSTFLIQRQDAPCGPAPQNLELLFADLETGTARRIFDKHSYAAFDPDSDTLLVQELARGTCADAGQAGGLVRLSAADAWVPRAVALPPEWGGDWEVRRIEWHPDLGQFSLRIGQSGGGSMLRLITLRPDGTAVGGFLLHEAESMSSANLFPSPEGQWILVGASAPHGTRLYNATGDLVRELVVEGGELSQGVISALWLPGQDALLMSAAAGPGIFRAAAADGWVPELVEPNARDGSVLTLVRSPARPFRQVCGGQNYSRLQLGDWVVVSYEPALSSRLRGSPGLTGAIVGMLEPGQRAQILNGPVCAGAYVWWQVEQAATRLRGWTAEGDAQGAWLLPADNLRNPGPLPTSTPSPAEPTPTPLPIAPLSRRGPWLVGHAGPPAASDEIRALNADGTGLTRLPGYWFPHAATDLRDGVSGEHSLVGLRNLSCGIAECYYYLRLFRLPELEEVFAIRTIYPDLASRAALGTWPGALAADPPLMAVGWEGPEPALLWSPDGRYLAFVGAIDGPSADVYAYDRLTSAVLRLTDGPGQPVLMGWSPDSRWVVHMEVEFEYGESGPDYEPVAVWAADVTGGPAMYLYASRGDLGDSEQIVGWRSEHEFVAAERDPLGRTGRLAQVDVQTGAFQTLYAGEVASAAVDPSSGTVAFVPYDPNFFPLGEEPLAPPVPAWAGAEGTVSEGGIYLLRRGLEVPERLEFEEWYTAYEGLEWISEVDRFFGVWSQTVSFTAEGAIGQVFPERYIPMASPNGKWLVFRRPPHFPGVAVYTPDGDQVYEFEGLSVSDILWKRDSSGVYLFWPESGLRLLSPSRRSYEVLHPDPGFIDGSLRLIYP